MIYIAITDISELDNDFISLDSLPKELRERVDKCKNKKEKKQRYAAYVTLFCLYKLKFPDKKMQEIGFTSYGKPYFVKKENNCLQEDIPCPVLNISHSEDLVAVAVGDARELGVDIQGELDKKLNIDKIEERIKGCAGAIYKKCRTKTQKFDTSRRVEWNFFHFLQGELKQREKVNECEEKKIYFEEISYENAVSDFYGKWAVLEACLKMSGEGFAGIKKADEKITQAMIETALLKDAKERRYFFALAYNTQNT